MRRGHRGEIGTLKASLEQLRAQLDALMEICAAAGVQVQSAAKDAVGVVPPGLIVASRTVRSAGGEPVTLIFPGDRRMLAVVSGGDPESILAEVSRLNPSPAGGGVLRLGYARLVSGLDAVAVPASGTVALTVSRALRPAEQRVAVRTALRASRRAGWLPSRVPAWIALPLLFRKHGLAVVSGKVGAAIAGGTAVVTGVVVAAALVTVPPAPQGSVRVIPVRPAPSRTVTAHRHRRRPVVVVTRRHRPHGGALAVTGSTPQPSPQSSSQPLHPLPTVSASVSASVPGQTCIWLLGVKVCLPA